MRWERCGNWSTLELLVGVFFHFAQEGPGLLCPPASSLYAKPGSTCPATSSVFNAKTWNWYQASHLTLGKRPNERISQNDEGHFSFQVSSLTHTVIQMVPRCTWITTAKVKPLQNELQVKTEMLNVILQKSLLDEHVTPMGLKGTCKEFAVSFFTEKEGCCQFRFMSVTVPIVSSFHRGNTW